MQDGVGRQGYRVLAWVVTGIGVVGLGAGWYAFAHGLYPFQWLGFGLAGASLVGLVAITMVILARASADGAPSTPAQPAVSPSPAVAAGAPAAAQASARPRVAETPAQVLPPPRRMVKIGPPVARRPAPAVGAPAKAATPGVTASPAPGARPSPGQGMEYKDAQPAAKAAPTQLVMPPAFEKDDAAPGQASAHDPRAWPERRGASGVLLGEMQNRAAQQLSVNPATVMAKIWYAQSTVPRGWQKGQCGDCGTGLMAPSQRPLRLRCPHCDKITDLDAPAGAPAGDPKGHDDAT